MKLVTTENSSRTALSLKTAAIAFLLFCTQTISSISEGQIMNTTVLNVHQQRIAAIAADAAKGDLIALKQSLTEGLNDGLTVNQIKEILVQTYAYCGFPRSLNALGTFMTLLKEREDIGITDVPGPLPSPLPERKSLDFGTENQTKLCGAPVKGELFEFAPAIDEYLKSHLFGDIFARDNLDWQTRELATVAMLSVIPGVEPQLKAHIGIAQKNGLTEAQTNAIITLAQKDRTQTESGKGDSGKVDSGKSDSDKEASALNEAIPQVSTFPLGKENTGYAQYFSGRSWLAPLTSNKQLNTPVFNVTFEPGCRNNWHKHTGGQMLICVGGVGYYQQRGQTARRLVPGDIVEIPCNVEHWHGAAPDAWFAHLAVECNPAENKNTWLEPVSDEDYRTATGGNQSAKNAPMIRLSKIKVDPAQLDAYNTLLKEGITRSMQCEPGVLTLYAVAEKDNPTKITILEIYADKAAYDSHIQSPHFKKYKEGTLQMVKDLELIDASPLIPGLKIK